MCAAKDDRLTKLDGLWFYRQNLQKDEPNDENWRCLHTSSLKHARQRLLLILEAERDDELLAAASHMASDLPSNPALLGTIRASDLRRCSLASIVNDATLSDILARLSLINAIYKTSAGEHVVQEVLGLQSDTSVSVSEAFDIYCEKIAIGKLHGKSPNQRRVWKLKRRKAVNDFIDVFGDIPMSSIGLEHARDYREVWRHRIDPSQSGRTYSAATANHNITILSRFYSSFWAYEGRTDRTDPFAAMRFHHTQSERVLPFSTSYIEKVLLDPETFRTLNWSARLIVYAMIETGARPSELVNLLPENISLDSEIPHLQIRHRRHRQLKTRSSERDIPLVGIALAVFRRCPYGFPRYFDREIAFCSLMSSRFRRHDLYPTARHRLYSLRHSFEARLLEAGVDYTIRCRLMGHYNARDSYGDGGSLALKRGALQSIAIPYPADIFDGFSPVSPRSD